MWLERLQTETDTEGSIISVDVSAIDIRVTTIESEKIHKAYVKTDPGDDADISAYLDVDDTGDVIDISAAIVDGTALNSAIPRIGDGDLIHVWEDDGVWRTFFPFQASEDCS